MENFNHSLPGIAQIGYCLCENIQPNIVLKHSSGIPVGIFTEIMPIRFFGQPSYEAIEEYDKYTKCVMSAFFVSMEWKYSYKVESAKRSYLWVACFLSLIACRCGSF